MKETEKEDVRPLELYVHIPFCVRKCRYCDFLSAPAGPPEQEAYLQALLREIGGLPLTPEERASRRIVSLFIGGGTPSLPAGEFIEKIVEKLKKEFIFSPDAEITIEANPGTLTIEKLQSYRRCGINRISLGLQSPKEKELQILGRIHTSRDFLESFQMARECGFSNINVDLMFALPGQTCEGWRENLRWTARLEPEHISAYSLIVEEGTPFASMELNLPGEDEEYRMYEDTAEILSGYGYSQYEISNYARDGFSCRHNEGYWKRRDYLGLGLGAASLYKEQRYSNTRSMEEYLKDSGEPGRIRKDFVCLSVREQMEEFMFLGLRMTAGVEEQEFFARFGRTMEEIYGSVLKKYEQTGFLQHTDGFWKFTRKGIHVSNYILADFLE